MIKTLVIPPVLLVSSIAFAVENDHLEELADLSIEQLAQTRIASIATGTKKPVSEVPAIATVITAQEIEASGASTFEEVLESIPGVHISRDETYMPKIQVRGISTKFNSQVLVMVNSIPITSIARGDRSGMLSVLPVKTISRIEIIRGPGSALYGADAVAGLINVYTKNADDINGTELGGRVGSFHSSEAWYLHGKKYGDLNASVMMSFQNTEGHRREITEDAQTGLDKALGTKASLAPGSVNLSRRRFGLFGEAEKEKWKLRGSYYDLGNAGTGSGTSGALDPMGKYSFSRATLDLTFHDPQFSEHWDYLSQVSFFHSSQEIDERLRLFPKGTNLGSGVFTDGMSGNPEFWERNIRFDNSAFYSGFENHRVRIGVGYYFVDLYKVQESRNFDPTIFSPLPVLTNVSDTNSSFIPEKSRWSYYSYLQDEWKFSEDWEFTAGLRYDRYSDFGKTLNPRAALVWKTTSKLTSKLLYGRAFRPPTFGELYSANNPINIGNPNLKPEYINVYELAWNYQMSSAFSLSYNIFYYRASRLIAVVKDASGVSASAKNYGTQTGRGFEFETKAAVANNDFIIANYAFVKARDEVTGKNVGQYPTHKAYLRNDWNFSPKWNWDTQLLWIGKRYRVPTDKRSSLRGYTTVDLTLARKEIYNKFTVALSAFNLFNADVREPSPGPGPTASSASIPHDLPGAGRSLFVSMSYQL